MVNWGCSGCSKYKVFFNLTTIFFVLALVLLIPGGGIYHRNRIAKKTYEQNTCEVMASSYYEKICGGGIRFGRTGPCFVPVWTVTYSVVEDMLINATIEDNDSFWTTGEAQHKVDQYQIGMSYTCWCSVVDPSQASWKQPNIFVGLILVIFGCLTAIVGIVGIFLTYRECKKLKI